MAEHDDKHGKSGEGAHGGGGGGNAHGGGGHGGGGHAEGEHEGAPEWLISFADNVTLMMGFFVIMLAMNMGPKGAAAAASQGAPSDNATATTSPDMLDLTLAIREAFHNPVSISSTNPEELPLVRRLIARAAGSSSETSITGREHDVQSLRPSAFHFPGGMVNFDDASKTLSPSAKEQITDFAQQVHGLRLIIELRGHVSAAEAYHLNDAGMLLSFQRAMAVEQALIEGGVDRHQIRIVACGDNEHIKDQAYSPEDQRQNQRVEVMVTEDLVTDRQMEPPPAAPASPPPPTPAPEGAPKP